MPVQTRRQLATDPEMCMFALTVSIVEPKNIKEAMADSAWIEAMQDELHQSMKEEVYVAQLPVEGFVDPDHPEKVYLLRKALYGLKQAQENGMRTFNFLDVQSALLKDSGFELTAFSDADHAGCIDTRKSTSGGIQFLGDKLVSLVLHQMTSDHNRSELGIQDHSNEPSSSKLVPKVVP
ncbi:retrovirus-related pol polyprotein from transposon TNT 1-94 [Tanacetum coccineum]|uniref:Retrovirus-related pol polyprotein from transposon TNT 1-94 n=1 Tax=Tanacetum coccineum TaxID=301880 RepID=A0ABQ5BL31_9ASTR